MTDDDVEPIHRRVARIERDIADLPPRARHVLLVSLIRSYVPDG